MALERVDLGPLYSRGVIESTPWGRACVCEDALVDGGVLASRAGYRNARASNTAVATPATGAQGIWKFRPHPDMHVVIAIIDGNAYWNKEVSDETVYLGAWTKINGPLVAPNANQCFTADAKVSAAQMGSYLYLGSDTFNAPWVRIYWNNSVGVPAFTAEAITALPPPVIPATSGFSESDTTVSWTKFSGMTRYAATSTATLYSTDHGGAGHDLPTDWRMMAGAAVGTKLKVDEFIILEFSPVDWRACKWLCASIVPTDTNSRYGAIEVAIAPKVSSAPGDFTPLGVIYDSDPQQTPNHVYFDLNALPVATRQAAVYIRLKIVDGLANQALYHALLYGIAAFRDKPMSRPLRYWATLQSTSTESVLSNELVCNPTATVIPPSMLDLFYAYDEVVGRTGTPPTITMLNAQQRCFNDQVGTVRPSATDVGTKISVRVNLPVNSSGTVLASAGQFIRLWLLTETGKRLVTTHTITEGNVTAGYATVADDSGWQTLSALLYPGGGPPPAISALACKGRRLIACGCAPTAPTRKDNLADQKQNRVYVSSYVAQSDTRDLYPQWPDVPTIDSDGWSMDFGSKGDVTQSVLVGDAVYILTAENVYSMGILAQDQVPQLVLAKGCKSRGGAVFAEDTLYWASSDGVYAARGRSAWQELSAEVRDFWRDTMAPNSTTTLTFKDRALYVSVQKTIAGTLRGRHMRYTVDEKRWSAGTWAHAIAAAAFWGESPTGRSQAWMLTTTGCVVRLHHTFALDDATAIPAFVYQTGYDSPLIPTVIKSIVADATAALTVSVQRDETEPVASTLIIPNAGREVERPGWAGMVGMKWSLTLSASGVVRAVAWSRDAVDKAY